VKTGAARPASGSVANVFPNCGAGAGGAGRFGGGAAAGFEGVMRARNERNSAKQRARRRLGSIQPHTQAPVSFLLKTPLERPAHRAFFLSFQTRAKSLADHTCGAEHVPFHLKLIFDFSMQHSRYFPLLLAGSLAALAGLGSGCRSKCDGRMNSMPPPAFGLVFSTDTLGAGKGFRKAEVLSAYAVRYAGADLTEPLDTVRANQRGNVFYYVDRTLFCNFPINSLATGPHSYRVEVPAAQRRYDVKDIVLQYGGVSDCTTSLDRLDALLNGQRVDARRGYVLTK